MIVSTKHVPAPRSARDTLFAKRVGRRSLVSPKETTIGPRGTTCSIARRKRLAADIAVGVRVPEVSAVGSHAAAGANSVVRVMMSGKESTSISVAPARSNSREEWKSEIVQNQEALPPPSL